MNVNYRIYVRLFGALASDLDYGDRGRLSTILELNLETLTASVHLDIKKKKRPVTTHL